MVLTSRQSSPPPPPPRPTEVASSSAAREIDARTSHPAESRFVDVPHAAHAESEDEDPNASDDPQSPVRLKLDLAKDRSPSRRPQPTTIKSQFLQPSEASRPPSAIPLKKDGALNSDSAANKVLRRDSRNRLRLFDECKESEHPVNLALQFVANMDLDQTQKSAMSLTQENSSSAYEHLDIEIQRFGSVSQSSDPVQGENSGGRLTQISAWKQQHSTRTDSTAHTYKEHDTGHIKLTYDEPEPEAAENEEVQSQDPSFAAPPNFGPPVHGHLCPPETPAPPVNPFSHKGSVLKGIEMFGATQPSSIGRHVASPTSTRPSPDIYNDFTSPVSKRAYSSPLARLIDHENEPRPEHDEQTPLRSSIPNLPVQTMPFETPHATLPRTSGIRSSDTLQRASSFPEPRRYNSLKESQERRKRQAEVGTLDSDSDGSDSDIEVRSRSKRLKMERAIRQQLGAVRMPPNRPRSSSAKMEHGAPSTVSGRRRSIQDDYVAQCNGFDARDTQQDDMQQNSTQRSESQEENPVIANSQGDSRGGGHHIEIPSSPPDRDNITQHIGISCIEVVNPSPAKDLDSSTEAQNDLEHVPATGPESTEHDIADTADSSKAEPELSLPLQELDSNRQSLRTPVASKQVYNSDVADDAVPETSPVEDRLRPMGEIGLSFGEGDEEEVLQNPPGFTQDNDFLDAIKAPAPALPHKLDPHKDALGMPFTTSNPPAVVAHENSSDAAQSPNVGIERDRANLPKQMDQQSQSNAANDRADEQEQGANGEVDQPTIVEALALDPQISEPPDSAFHIEMNIGSPSGETFPAAQPNTGIQDERPEASSLSENQKKTPQALAKGKDPAFGPSVTSSKRELRSKTELKGPSRALRRSTGTLPLGMDATPKDATRASVTESAAESSPSKKPVKQSVQTNTKSSKSASSSRKQATVSPGSIPEATKKEKAVSAPRSARRQAVANEAAKLQDGLTPAFAKRSLKRKSGVTSLEDGVKSTPPPRASERQSKACVTRDSSEDPIALTAAPISAYGIQPAKALFTGMAFAVSYVKNDNERDAVTRNISDNGGEILTEGFDGLFDFDTGSSTKGDEIQVSLTAAAKTVGFAAVIADEHSRKAKYMQALALGLPCISGRWILTCVARGLLIDWSQYLLCAGQSRCLNGAHLSRNLVAYPAANASLESTVTSRGKMLQGKSILLVTGKSRKDEKRKTFTFLTRVLGPDRLCQVTDYPEARKKLIEGQNEGNEWDLLYVDGKNKKSESEAIFGPGPAAPSAGSRKRKGGPTGAAEDPSPAAKKIRLLDDEDIVQSLIFGQLVDEE